METSATADTPPILGPWRRFAQGHGCWKLSALPFWGVHAAAIAGVIWLGWSFTGLALAVALYYARMFFISAGYHRYFAHRTYKTSRAFQLLLALGAQTSAQKGVLWWASHHRHHHKFSDTPDDVHSPKQRGFWYAHVGWVLSADWMHTDEEAVRDLSRYPELRFLNHEHVRLLPAVLLAFVCFLLGGAFGLVWGFFVSTVLLWHGTFTINSLSHMIGRRRYDTSDDSRNNWVLALLTMGEGWHNNHHHYQSAVNQGWRWWEIDLSYYLLRLLAVFGVVWDLRRPPAHALAPHAPAASAHDSRFVAAMSQPNRKRRSGSRGSRGLHSRRIS